MQRDSFERQALESFLRTSSQPFWRLEPLQGELSLRYATADVMVSQLCADCHNSFSADPSQRWEIGDVAGVLEVTVPVGATIRTIRKNAAPSLLIAAAVFLALGTWLAESMRHSVARPMESFGAMTRRVAEGDLTGRFKVVSTDEVGEARAAMNTMLEALCTTVGTIVENVHTLSTASGQLTELALTMREDADRHGLECRGRDRRGRCGERQRRIGRDRFPADEREHSGDRGQRFGSGNRCQ